MPKRRKVYKERLEIQLSYKLKTLIDREAVRLYLTRNELIRRILEKWIEAECY